MIAWRTSKGSTIKNDPLAAVIPMPDDEMEVSRPKSRELPLSRRKLTVHLRGDVIERVKNAAYWKPGTTIAAIAESGILRAIEEVEREHGGPYPPREQELRGGRPIK